MTCSIVSAGKGAADRLRSADPVDRTLDIKKLLGWACDGHHSEAYLRNGAVAEYVNGSRKDTAISATNRRRLKAYFAYQLPCVRITTECARSKSQNHREN
ncbi:hypothetical protein [Bradyrhizobium sp. Arg816]|uniref:hypothetical protein n=1 Tax=Bradyrhizobium sp. Arg816 TaxID=2998491 RepID=UPI00249E6FEF|nr:hypothetical protein [Bradyrhizobium sp. Arg816]MDI3561148.1 hypothetical protein [Bradyrhizobium sp. Arg816]